MILKEKGKSAEEQSLPSKFSRRVLVVIELANIIVLNQISQSLVNTHLILTNVNRWRDNKQIRWFHFLTPAYEDIEKSIQVEVKDSV